MKKKSCPCCLVMRNFTNGFCEYCGMPVEWLTAYQELKECQISLQCPDGKLRWFHSSLFEHGYAGVFEKLRKHCRVCDKCEQVFQRDEHLLQQIGNLGYLIIELRKQ